jgi:hypothetical protein
MSSMSMYERGMMAGESDKVSGQTYRGNSYAVSYDERFRSGYLAGWRNN